MTKTKYAVHFANGNNQQDGTFAEEGVEVVVIDWDRLENGECPYCKAENEMVPENEVSGGTICLQCGFDAKWDGDEILKWIIAQKRKEKS
jgi:hypothetical protein